MSLSEVTTTFNLHDYFGDSFDARRTKGWATNNADNQTIHDNDTGETRIGSGYATINSDGTGTFTHWAPGPDGNPTSWQTTYHFDVPDRSARGGRRTESFGPYTVTSSGLLTALVEEQAVPPTYLTTVTTELQTYVDAGAAASTSAAASATSAAASADLASAIAGADTADDLITILDADAGSDFRVQQDARLSATYATVERTALPTYAGARTNSWDKGLSLYNGESQTLRTIRSKVRAGMFGTAACRIGCVGDSKTFGSGIAPGTYTGKDSYPAQLRDLLGGYNSFVVANGSDYRWTSVTNVGSTPSNRNDMTFSTGGGSVRFTSDTPHTGFKLYGYLSAGGSVTVTTDGGSGETWTVTSGSPWRTFTKTGLSDATHTVLIAGPANFALRGIELTYASGTKLFVDNHGRQSSTWSHWNDRSVFITYGTSTFDGVTSGVPDVCLLNLGTNTPTLDADFDSLLDYIVTTKGIPTMLLVPGGLGGLAAESTYDARRDRIYDNADRLDLPLLDLGRVIGAYDEANDGSLMGDTIHENKAGYRLEARAIASAIAYA